jgi:putative acyl-CoA dehydrogenase
MNRFATHEVLNQSPPLPELDLCATDRALQEAVEREGGGAKAEALSAFGRWAGSNEAQTLGRLANENPPRLRTHDAKGSRLDIVEFHPAWHELMRKSMEAGLHTSVWDHLAVGSPQPGGAHVERAVGFYLANQVENGHCCPITMTSAAAATIALEPALAKTWLPRIVSRRYDARFLPATAKTGITLGMGMTEKQGGTDVRANTTAAKPLGTSGPGAEYIITGHKWFMSAPMSDAFLVLAQAPKGLTCFLTPRFRPDGSVNALHIQRLKDKLGNRSNASSEVEFADASAFAVGEEGRGVATIIEMVTHTRLDCALGSAAIMRRALIEAIHHSRHRNVMDRPLGEHPLMAHALADLAVESEAALVLAMRVARSFDRASDPRAAAWRRLMTPVTKYWICKTAPAMVAECMECLGGNGYVEESVLPRLYREAPVNSIWEGSGNVMALDVLRVLQREPESVGIVVEDLRAAAGDDPHLKAALARVQSILHEPRLIELRARALLDLLALLAAAIILRAHAPQAVSDAFIAGRLSGVPRQSYGQGLEWCNTKAILERAFPL